MRVLIVRPGVHFSVIDVHNGWKRALNQLGCTVGDFNFDDRLDFYTQIGLMKNGEFVKAVSHEAVFRLATQGLHAACYNFDPDVVLLVSGFFMPLDMLDVIRAHGSKLVILFTESPYEDDQQLERAHNFDTVLLNDPTNLEQFRQVTDAHYIPHAYDPAVHHPGAGDPDFSGDFGFVGTGFPSRIELFEKIEFDGLTVRLGGNWQSLKDDSPLRPYLVHRAEWCMDNTETVSLYQSVKASLNYYRREASDGGSADGVAMGPREVELAATGCFFLRDPRPEGDELFPMLPTFTEAADVRPLLDWWLTHDTERERATRAAFEKVRDRTFENHARWLLDHLKLG